MTGGDVSPLQSPTGYSPHSRGRSVVLTSSHESPKVLTPLLTKVASMNPRSPSPPFYLSTRISLLTHTTVDSSLRSSMSLKPPTGRLQISPEHRAKSRKAQKLNDSIVYLGGPRVFACAKCRTHLTSQDDIISKSFHGRHGRAFLVENAVNVVKGPVQERWLMTGFHEVCDINCKRCDQLVGWTYVKAYEQREKYKEGKFVIEKINLHLENDSHAFDCPSKRPESHWRERSSSWGSRSSSWASSDGGSSKDKGYGR